MRTVFATDLRQSASMFYSPPFYCEVTGMLSASLKTISSTKAHVVVFLEPTTNSIQASPQFSSGRQEKENACFTGRSTGNV